MKEFEQCTLPNGIRLIHRYKNGVEVSHCGLIINAGSRDEGNSEQGLAHYIEHCLFKGTQKRKAYHVLSRLDNVGGELNAYTSKEETAIYASFMSAHYERAMELIVDITFRASYPEKEIAKEKEVIIDEIHSYMDSPAEQIFDEFEEQVFAGHSIGRNILGTVESVRGLTRTNILDFVHKRYRTDQMVFASVGSLPFEKVRKLAMKHLTHMHLSDEPVDRVAFDRYTPLHKEVKRDTHQVHYVLGAPAYDYAHDRKRAMVLLTNVLGGPGMNSRLNLNIREKHGIAYNIEAHYQPYTDTGLFTVYLGTDLSLLNRSKRLLRAELRKLREKKLGTAQLHQAKQQLIGHIALAQESGSSLMLALGKSALLYDRVDTTEEIFREVETITASDLLEIANEMFDERRMSSLTFL